MPVDPSILRIVSYPDTVLRAVARPVAQVTDEVRAVARRMLELMHEAPGVGLAAPQVGLSWRLFVANPTGEPQDDAIYVNPVLSSPSRQVEDAEEGCLSLPRITAEIRRPRAITLDALDLEGRPIHTTAEGFEARIWQHEMDHLDGVLILDRMTPIDRMANQKLLRELESAGHR
jgi:peptide deformylase